MRIKEYCKRKSFIVFGILLVFVVLLFTIPMCKRKFPENEWHSRRGCRINLLQIKSSLKKYLEHHDNKMPANLYELVEEGHIDQSRFICPSQYNEVKKASQDPTYSSTEYSYRIVNPSIKIDSLNDGEVLIEELRNNHPASVVGDISYSSGYYVIKTRKGELVIEFLEE